VIRGYPQRKHPNVALPVKVRWGVREEDRQEVLWAGHEEGRQEVVVQMGEQLGLKPGFEIPSVPMGRYHYAGPDARQCRVSA
jgi:hypothetical protein